MSNLDKLLNRLDDVKGNGYGKYLARCPAHADKSPSLAIKEIEGDKLLIKCWAGCSTESVLSAIGLTFSDLFPEKPQTYHAFKRNEKNYPKFQKAELFEPLLNAAMLVLISVNSLAGNPLEKPHFFKEPFTDEDFLRMVQALAVIDSVYREVNTR